MENVAPGEYSFDVLDSSSKWEFDQVNYRISSSEPKLPDLRPTRVAVCPKVSPSKETKRKPKICLGSLSKI